MALLVYLCKNAQQVVTFDELNQAIWPKEIVGDNAIYNLVGQLRKALGDKASSPTYIQTVSKVGYRLLVSATPLFSDIEEPTGNNESSSLAPKSPVHRDKPKKKRGMLGFLFFIIAISTTTAIVSSKKRYHAPNEDAATQIKLARYQLYRDDSDGINQAIERLQLLITANPKWVIPKIELAYSYLRKAALAPDDSEFWSNKAFAIASESKLGDAGKRLNEVINAKRQLHHIDGSLFEAADVLTSARLAYSDILFAQGKIENALEQASLAKTQCVDCPYVYRKIATIKMVLGQVQEGFRSFSQYRQLINNKSNHPANNAGYIKLTKQSLEAMANWHFETPLPTKLLGHQRNALALFYLSLGVVERAEEIVEPLLDQRPNFYDLYTHAAIAGAKGDINTSYDLLLQRQRDYPDNERFKLSVVYALWQLGKYEDAMSLTHQFALVPFSSPLPDHLSFEKWSVYAALLNETGKKKDANAIFDKLEQQLLASYSAGSQEADIRLASLYALQGKANEALSEMETAIAQGWVSDFNQNWWYLQDSPYFAPLADNKTFQRIVADYHQSVNEVFETAKQLASQR
jgi:DNA-binding winged helix-turn-helix (wHTH) protein/predicted Zn-dependent protease